ncbi:MAG: glycosyltransferase [Elainellaceae cyanobacterium]
MAQAQNATRSPSARINSILLVALSLCGLTGLFVLQNPGYLSFWEVFSLLGLGIIGVWRWLWFFYRVVRSRIYLHGVFPRWRRQAHRVPVEALPHMCFLVPSYQEEPWITERVFKAIAREAKTLAQPITLLVNSSSDAENEAIRALLEQEDPGLTTMRTRFMVQKDGKRKAMADALRELAQLDLPADTVVALMDGDSELAPGVLRQCLPFFRLFPKMGALTTDELPMVQGSYLFSEWFHLRFAQRHVQMCSDALARKVMCLTGRFSLFRAEAALDPSFADRLEHDAVDDWLWGRFKFLSGDDKSTWFWLLRRGYDMLYIPDAMVYSIETVSGSVVDRAYSNMRRWYGNMLRNNGRAIALGPRKTGWFTWYSLIDQRISFWTCLITPGFLLISLLQGSWVAAGIVLSWVTFSRPLTLGLVFLGRPSVMKTIHFPLMLSTQWAASLVKIWTQMNLAQQSWTNRGNQSINADGQGLGRIAKRSTSYTLLGIQAFSFVIVLAWLSGILNPLWDIAGLRLTRQTTADPLPVQTISAIDHGVWPNDGRDDAEALNQLIQTHREDKLVIQLPIGELEFFEPLTIDRSRLTLQGQGPERTIFTVRFNSVGSARDSAAVVVAPAVERLQGANASQTEAASPESRHLEKVHLKGFTIRYGAGSPDGEAGTAIAMHQVNGGSITRIQLERSQVDALVLEDTTNVQVERVVFEAGPEVASLPPAAP